MSSQPSKQNLPEVSRSEISRAEISDKLTKDSSLHTHAMVTRSGVALGALMILTAMAVWVTKDSFGLPGTLLTIFGASLVGLSVWSKISVKAGPIEVRLEKEAQKRKSLALAVLITIGVAIESVCTYAVLTANADKVPALHELHVPESSDALPSMGSIIVSDKLTPESACSIGMNHEWKLVANGYFLQGESRLTRKSESHLRTIADLISKSENCEVEIIGHTSPEVIGEARRSRHLELSVARALTVAKYFIAEGVDPRLITVIGVGDKYARSSRERPAEPRTVEVIVTDITPVP